MATKIPTTELKVGMFVADLDRPWVDTPFLLQGFLIEDEEQIRALVQHCQYVMVDRTRSTGDQYQAPLLAQTVPPEGSRLVGAPKSPAPGPAARGAPASGRPASPSTPPASAPRAPRGASTASRSSSMRAPYAGQGAAASAGAGGEGLFGRLASGLRGLWHKERKPAPVRIEPVSSYPYYAGARRYLSR